MRKTLWIVLAVLVAVIGAPVANADSYTILFSGGPGAPTVVGSDSVTYDPTTNLFTTPSIEISYYGNDIALYLDLYTPGYAWFYPTDTFAWVWSYDGLFHIYDMSQAGIEIYGAGYLAPGSVSGTYLGNGPVTFEASTVPEPGTFLLMLTGLGVLGWMMMMRK